MLQTGKKYQGKGKNIRTKSDVIVIERPEIRMEMVDTKLPPPPIAPLPSPPLASLATKKHAHIKNP